MTPGKHLDTERRIREEVFAQETVSMRCRAALLTIIAIFGWTGSTLAEPKIVRDVGTSSAWISGAMQSSGYRADFSLESLKEVDRFFDEQTVRGAAKPGGLLSEQLGARLFALGSYVGEVIRRQAGGVWKGNDNDPQAEINVAVQLKSGAIFWPVQRVMKRFRNGPEDGIWVYGKTLVASKKP